jgi:hypothetical protein
MKDVIAPAKKIVAREPKVAKGGMGKQSSGTYNRDCHGAIPAKENVRATVAKVKSAR